MKDNKKRIISKKYGTSQINVLSKLETHKEIPTEFYFSLI